MWDAVQASAFAPAASTLLGVALLGYDGQLVEIEATALVPAYPGQTRPARRNLDV